MGNRLTQKQLERIRVIILRVPKRHADELRRAQRLAYVPPLADYVLIGPRKIEGLGL